MDRLKVVVNEVTSRNREAESERSPIRELSGPASWAGAGPAAASRNNARTGQRGLLIPPILHQRAGKFKRESLVAPPSCRRSRSIGSGSIEACPPIYRGGILPSTLVIPDLIRNLSYPSFPSAPDLSGRRRESSVLRFLLWGRREGAERPWRSRR